MKLTSAEIKTLATLMAKADREDLNLIADMHKNQSRKINSKVAGKFNVGDKVQFDAGQRGGIITGTVMKVNPKNIKLDCGVLGKWNVTATLLTKI